MIYSFRSRWQWHVSGSTFHFFSGVLDHLSEVVLHQVFVRGDALQFPRVRNEDTIVMDFKQLDFHVEGIAVLDGVWVKAISASYFHCQLGLGDVELGLY